MALSARDYERCVKMLTKYADKLTNGNYPCAVVYSTRSGALKQAGSKVLGELIRRNADEFIKDDDWMEDDRCSRGTVLPKLEEPAESLPLHRLRSLIPVLLSAELGNKRPVYEDRYRPEWWPVEVPYVNVRQKPDIVESGTEWRKMLVDVVTSCYQHFEGKGLEDVASDDETEMDEHPNYEALRPQGLQTSRPLAPQLSPRIPDMSRALAPQMSRQPSPQISRPSTHQSFRPSTPQSFRPSTPQSFRPSKQQNTRPSTPQSTRPSTPQSPRPSTPLSTRPSTPQSTRPSTPQSTRPSNPQNTRLSIPQNTRLSTPPNIRPFGPRVPSDMQEARHSTPLHYIPIYGNSEENSVDQQSHKSCIKRLSMASPKPAKRQRKPKQVYTPS